MFSEAIGNTISLYNLTLQASKITSELWKHCTKYTVAVRIYVQPSILIKTQYTKYN